MEVWNTEWPDSQCKTCEKHPNLNTPHTLPLILSELQCHSSRSSKAENAWNKLKSVDNVIQSALDEKEAEKIAWRELMGVAAYKKEYEHTISFFKEENCSTARS